MAKKKDSRGSIKVVPVVKLNDELSLDELDRVSGGTGLTPREEHLFANAETPAPVPVPQPVPAPQQVEPAVSRSEGSHPSSEVGHYTSDGGYTEGGRHYQPYVPPPPPPPPAVDHAVSDIASHLGSADANALHGASAQIISLMEHGQARPVDAIMAITDAVGHHSLSGDQAVGLMADMFSSGDINVRTEAYRGIMSLIDTHQMTASHAVETLSILAGQSNASGRQDIVGNLEQFITQYQVPATDVVSGIHGAVVSHALTGDQAVDVLLSLTGSAADYNSMIAAAGKEIGHLVADHQITAAEVMTDVKDALAARAIGSNFVIPMLLGAVEVSNDLMAPVGASIVNMIATTGLTEDYAMTLVKNAVSQHVISADHAVGVLVGAMVNVPTNTPETLYSAYNYAWRISEFVSSGQVTNAQAAADIYGLVSSHQITASQMVSVFGTFAVNSPPEINAALGNQIAAMVANGELSATQVIADMKASAGMYSRPDLELSSLLTVAASASASAELRAAIDADLDALIASRVMTPENTLAALTFRLGGNQALNDLVSDHITSMLASGAITADQVISQIAISQSYDSVGTPRYAAGVAEIVSLISHGHISAQQAMTDIARSNSYGYQPGQMLTTIAVNYPDLAGPAIAQFVSLIGGSFTPQYAADTIGAMAMTWHGITAEQAVGMLSAVAMASANPAVMAATGNEILTLITKNALTASQAMDGIHKAVTATHTLGADAALTLLANIAASGSTAVKDAVSTEMAALVSSHAMTAAHAVEVLSGLSLNANVALQNFVSAQIALLAPGTDPVEVMFSRLEGPPTAAQFASISDQIASLIAQGRVTAATAIADIDRAVTGSHLSGSQAMTLLFSIAGHGDAAVLKAAGQEIAAVWGNVNHNDAFQLFKTAVSSHTITNDQAVNLLLEASLGRHDVDRARAFDFIGGLVNWGLASYAQMIDGVTGMLADHRITGQQAVGILAQMSSNGVNDITPQIARLLNDHTISMADVHAAIVSNAWNPGRAIVSLAKIGGEGNAEIVALISGGVVSVNDALRTLEVATASGGYGTSFEQRLTSVLAISAAFGATYEARISADIGSTLFWGHLTPDQVAASVAALTASGSVTAEQAFASLGRGVRDMVPDTWANVVSGALVSMVAGNQVSIDRAIAMTGSLVNGATAIPQFSNALATLIGGQQISAAAVMAQIDNAVAAHKMSGDQAAVILAGLAAQGDAAIAAAARGEIVSLCSGGQLVASQVIAAIHNTVGSSGMTMDQAVSLLVGLAGPNVPALQVGVGNEIAALIGQNSITLDQAVTALKAAVASSHLSPDQLLTVLGSTAANVPAAAQTEVFNIIATMVSGGEISVDRAIKALSLVAASATPSTIGVIVGEIGTLVANHQIAPSQAMDAIGSALTSHALTAQQATSLLAGMMRSDNATIREAAVAELGTLVSGGQIPAAVMFASLNDAIRAGVIDGHVAVTTMLQIAHDNTTLATAVSEAIGAMVAQGQVTMVQVVADIASAASHNNLDAHQAIALIGRVFGSVPNAQVADAFASITSAVSGLLLNQQISGAQAMADIAAAFSTGAAIEVIRGTFAKAVAGVMSDAGVAAVGSMLSVHPSLLDPQAAIATLRAGLPQLMLTDNRSMDDQQIYLRVVSQAGDQYLPYIAKSLAELGRYETNQYGTVRSSDYIIARINDALYNHSVTPEQGAKLYVLLASNGDAPELALHTFGAKSLTEGVKQFLNVALQQHLMTDVQAMSAFRALSHSSDHAIADAATKLFNWQNAGLQARVDLAGQGTAADAFAAGVSIGEGALRGEIRADWLMQSIAAGFSNHSYSSEQAIALMASVIGAGTRDQWNGGVSSITSNWLKPIGDAVAALVQGGADPAAIMTGIGNAVSAGALTGSQATMMLAGVAMHSELRSAAAAEIGALVADGRLSAVNAFNDMKVSVSDQWGLSQDGAAAMIALIAAAPRSAPATVDAAMASLMEMRSPLATDVVVNLANSHDLSGSKALTLLTSMAARETWMAGPVGQALGTLVVNHQIAMSDVRALVLSNTLSDHQDVVLLAAMTQRGDAAFQTATLAEISGLIASGKLSAADVATDISSAVGVAGGAGLQAGQAIAVMVNLGLPGSDNISRFVSAGQITAEGAVAILAETAGHGTEQARAAAASAIASLAFLPYDRMAGALASVVPSRLTVDEGLGMMIGLMGNPWTGAVVGGAIAGLIASGQCTPEHAAAYVHNAVMVQGYSADKAVLAVAGMAGANPSPAIQIAAAAEINALISGGKISAAQAMADIDSLCSSADQRMNQMLIDRGDRDADKLRAINAGGGEYTSKMTPNDAIVLLALISSTAKSEGTREAVGTELGRVITDGRIPTPAATAVAVIDDAVNRGVLTPDQAIVAMAEAATGSVKAAQAARDALGPTHPALEASQTAGDQAITMAKGLDKFFAQEIVSLIGAHKMTPDHAVGVLATLSQSSDEIAAVSGRMMSTLLNGNSVTLNQAISGIHAVVADHTLEGMRAVQLLVNLGAQSDDAARTAVNAEIAALISGKLVAADQAANGLATMARQSDAALGTAIGQEFAALVAAHVMTPAQVQAGIAAAYGSNYAMGSRILPLIIGASASGDVSLQAAVGSAMYTASQGAYDFDTMAAGLVRAVQDGKLPGSHAAVTLTAFAGMSPVAAYAANGVVDPRFATGGQIGQLFDRGLAAPGQLLADIHAAVVGGGLSADQVIKVLPFIAQGSINTDLRAWYHGEITALVKDGLATAAHAADLLISVAPTGSPYLRTMVGQDLGALVAQGLLAPDVAAATAARLGPVWVQSTQQFDTSSLLIGLSAMGPAANQAAADAMLLQARNHTNDMGIMTGEIASAAAAPRVGLEPAVELLTRLLVGSPAGDHEATRRHEAILSSLIGLAGATDFASSGRIVQILAGVAAAGSADTQAVVGIELGALVQSGKVPASFVSSTLVASVEGHGLTADQALTILANEASRNPQSASEIHDGIASLVSKGLTTPDHAVEVLQNIAAHGDAKIQTAVGVEIGIMMATNVIAPAQAMSILHNAVTSHALTAEQAMAILASAANLPSNHSSDAKLVVVEKAVAIEIGALVSASLINAAAALNQLTEATMTDHLWMVEGGLPGQRLFAILACAATFGGAAVHDAAIQQIILNTQKNPGYSNLSPLSLTEAANSIHQTFVLHMLNGDQMMALLMDLAVRGSGFNGVAFDEVGALVSGKLMTPEQVVSGLMLRAGSGDQAFIGDHLDGLIGGKTITLAQAISGIHGAITSHVVTPDQGVAILAGLAGSTTRPVMDGVVAEFNALVAQNLVPAEQIISDLRNTLSAEQALTVMMASYATGAASIRGAAFQEILLDTVEQHSASRVINTLHTAVASGLVNADQSLFLLSNVVLNNSSTRTAVNEEISALIAGKLISANAAVSVLASVANDQPLPMQSVVANELLSILSHNQMTAGTAMFQLHNEARANGSNDMIHLVALMAAMTTVPADRTAMIAELGSYLTTNYSVGAMTAAAIMADIRACIAPNAMTADQAVLVLSCIYQTGQPQLQALVGGQVVSLVSEGKISAAQAVADIDAAVASNALNANRAIMLLSNAVVSNRADLSQAAVAEVAKLELSQLGVAAGSSAYTALYDGITHVAADFLQVAAGRADAAVNEIKQYASSHNIPSDLLLTVLVTELQGLSPRTAAQTQAASYFADQIASRMSSGESQMEIARLVANGNLPADAADRLVNAAATAGWTNGAHLPPANQGVWTSAALDTLHVDIKIQTDLPRVISGQISIDTAIIDIQTIAVAPNSGHVKDIALMELSKALHASGNSETVRNACDSVDRILSSHIVSGSAAAGLAHAATTGLLTAAQVESLVRQEAATSAGHGDVSFLTNVGLARLYQAAENELDKYRLQAGWQYPASYVNSTNAALNRVGSVISGLQDDVRDLLAGAGALLFSAGSAAERKEFTELGKQLMSVYVNGSIGAGEQITTNQQVEELKSKSEEAVAFLLGQADSLKEQFANFGGVPSSAIKLYDDAVNQHKFDYASWIELGGSIAATGLPRPPLFDTLMLDKITGIDALTPNLQDLVTNGIAKQLFGEPETLMTNWRGSEVQADGGYIFTCINITSNALLTVMKNEVVAGALTEYATGPIKDIAGTVAASCALLSDTISGSVKAATTDITQLLGGTYDTMKNLGQGHFSTAEDFAKRVGQAYFQLAFGGVTVESFAAAGVATGEFIYDLFAGHTGDLEGDAKKLGAATLHMITDSYVIKGASEAIMKYGSSLTEVWTDPSNSKVVEGLAWLGRYEMKLLNGGYDNDIKQGLKDIGDKLNPVNWF